MRHSLLASLAFISMSVACLDPGRSVAMQDSFEITLLGPAHEDLHTPYVAGARFGITVASTDYSSTDTSSWTLKSSDPMVLSVDAASSSPAFRVTAVAAGLATLTVTDAKGTVLDQHDVEVAQPDSVQLAAHGLLLAGLSDSSAQVSQASVVEGGTETFLVRYFKGSQELYGNGAVTTTSIGAVTATTTTSSFADDRDWVEVDAGQSAGSGQVSLSVDGHTVATIPALVVAPSSIARVGTLAESDASANDGDSLHVFARAFDSQGRDVYGASFSWQVGAAAAAAPAGSGPTDVLVYKYKGSASEAVASSFDGYSSSITVHGSGGTVDSTANTGCSIAQEPGTGGVPGGMLGLVVCGACALVARRRHCVSTPRNTRMRTRRITSGEAVAPAACSFARP